MSVHYQDDWLTVLHGDALTELATLPAESVHCVVTSPPYWGLRDYGTASWEGGNPECDHRGAPFASSSSSLAGYTSENVQVRTQRQPMGQTCSKCGAHRIDSQLGLEPTPEEYVANLVAVFREVRRVLRSDGTVWLNLGDSYASSGGERTYGSSDNGTGRGPGTRRHDVPASGLKPKDLVGVPWRVAFALQADGWYLRSDIIWAKPNPMPESVTDRPTRAHEYLFLLSKSQRYYFDADAVREADSGQDHNHRNVLDGQPSLEPSGGILGAHGGLRTVAGRNGSGRNIRSVWTIATAPYPGAHFATFPPKLVEPCIKAGSSERGVCPECGAPWEPIIERTKGRDWTAKKRGNDRLVYGNGTGADMDMDRIANPPRKVGMRPTCRHDAEPIPATVLDPFAGSGTTGMVAQSLSRRAILIDLSVDYLGQLLERNRDIPLGLGA